MVLVLAGVVFSVVGSAAGAQNSGIDTIKNCDDLGIPCTGSEESSDLVDFITDVVNVFLALAGVVAVIFIIWGGVRYVSSRGDEQSAGSAKRTILYAAIGLIVIGLSAVIVNFVLRAIRGDTF
jgi:hypothetical protein